MQPIRHLLAQRHVATLICAAALLLRMLVPTGYMIDRDHGRFTITICSGTALMQMTMDVSPHAPAMHGGDMAGHGEPMDHGKSEDHGRAEMPCAFSSLSAAALAAIDPLLLAILIAFVLATGFSAVAPPLLSRTAYLRPPLRGPPARL